MYGAIYCTVRKICGSGTLSNKLKYRAEVWSKTPHRYVMSDIYIVSLVASYRRSMVEMLLLLLLSVLAPREIVGDWCLTMTVVQVIHLSCFATSWGATVWAIFVGGVVMFM